jgi:hypothetical protein
MKVTLAELFTYRQYVGIPISYCFDRKTYSFCESSFLYSSEDSPYPRYIPLFQINQEQIQEMYILQKNEGNIQQEFLNRNCCFEEFIQRRALWNDWWSYYRMSVFQTAKSWCADHSIKYEG